MGDYYVYEVDGIDTKTEFREIGLKGCRPESEYNNKKYLYVDDDNIAWRLDGIEIYKGLSSSDLKRLFADWWTNDGFISKIRVEDNGRDGDGLWLRFNSHYQGEDVYIEYFSIELTHKQAVILAQALIGAANMRKVQEE